MLRAGVTVLDYTALLRSSQQRRTKDLPRDVRQILCLSLACLTLMLACFHCTTSLKRNDACTFYGSF